MEALSPTEQAVLDAAAESAGDLEHLYQRLHRPPRPAPLADVADAVRSLVQKGLLAARPAAGELPDDPSFVWKARFEPVPRGEGDPAPQEPRKSLFGIWKDLGVPSITAEEIAEMRREMWANFPREFPE